MIQTICIIIIILKIKKTCIITGYIFYPVQTNMNLVIDIIQIFFIFQKIKLPFFPPKDTFSLMPTFFLNILKFSLNDLIIICIIYI